MFGSNKRKYEIALNGWAKEIMSLNPFLREARTQYIRTQLGGVGMLGIEVDPEVKEVIDDLIDKINNLYLQEGDEFPSPSYPPAHMGTDAAKFIINTTLSFISESEDEDEYD